MSNALLWTVRVLIAAVWLYANYYLVSNRRALAKLLRGYGAYEVWKSREWVAGWEDAFDLGDAEKLFSLEGEA